MYRVWLRKSEEARDFVSVDEIVHIHESSHGGTLGEASSRLVPPRGSIRADASSVGSL